MDINTKPNETMQSINGYNIAGSIDGLSVKVIEAGWWRVDHQSTDFFIIGKFIFLFDYKFMKWFIS